MAHEIVVGITTEAQAAAVRAGQSGAAVQRYELPAGLAAEALDLGADVLADGSVRLRVAVERSHDGTPPRRAYARTAASEALSRRPVDAADALVLIRERAQAIAAETAAAEAERLARLEAEVDAAADRGEHVSPHVREAIGGVPALAERLRAADRLRCVRALGVVRDRAAGYGSTIESLIGCGRTWAAAWAGQLTDAERAEVAATRDRIAAEERAAEQADREAAAALALARLRRLAREVRELRADDADVITRLDQEPAPLGLLPEAEALDIVRDARLSLAEGLASRERITDRDVCECGRVEYHRDQPDAIPRDAWTAVRRVRAALRARQLPEGTIVRHVGTCPCEDVPNVVRWGLSVRLDLGDGLIVTREYEVPFLNAARLAP